MADFVDLHIHTDHSDGRQSPRQAVDRALALGLKAIAITDHDTISGYLEAQTYAQGKEVEVIAGIELSATRTDEDIHILGYLFRPDCPRLGETLERFRQIRYDRGKKMLERLARLDVIIDYADVLAAAADAPVGRPHIADILVKAGYVTSYDEAFRKYLELGGPAYVPKAKLMPEEAVDLIHEAGGVAVMAHPALTGHDEIIDDMVAAGLDGIEIVHPTHSRSDRKRYRQLARRHGLFCTGGSDSHKRPGRYGEIGDGQVPYETLTNMQAAWRARAGRH
jgi:predicted metal-dependent phosphoesterase TrpH